jgi:hypothetical protein
MSGKKGVPMIASFMDLPEVFNGLNIRFFVTEKRQMKIEEINTLVEQTAKKLVKRHSGRDLHFKSLAELGGHIYQMSFPVDREVDPGPEITVNERRKIISELGPKQMSS